MSFPPFALYHPKSLGKAFELARYYHSDFAFLAGGTDMLCNLSQKLHLRKHLIALSGIAELSDLSPTSIGAGVTIAELARRSDILPPIVSDTARLIAAPAIREAATVGGNLLLSGRCMHFNQSPLARCANGACMKAEGTACIAVPQEERCYAPFSGDLAPVLMVLNASLVIASLNGTRTIPLNDFYLRDGIHSSVLQPEEIVLQVLLPDDSFSLQAKYRKLRARSAVDFPEAGVAVGVKRLPGAFSELRVALGALGPAPVVTCRTREELEGDSSKLIAAKLWKELKPTVLAVRNTMFPPSYRREMAKHYLEELISDLLQ